ncbi:phosphogluconate dehydratase [Endozoicomonas sp. SM1973]|uniref:Phosphogluconate dehydratase n=1 Tax=Spartinivicinus marinus TaxID=2994442 RepID=A0A853I7U0_9GAMM|nr:phosphogluconate dehydratase [Spartinivicinus marinus]MCX4027512.1 phosphogluconate dehydratase [Spartinivicinus marinus]NYZ68889.1 phosphogluconate dehydratase [Spartinivicinus marinus]
MHPVVDNVTRRVIERSRRSRQTYLQAMEHAEQKGPHRGVLSCGNLAHGFAACSGGDKQALKMMNQANIGIISSYNDMLSAHQPLEVFPEIIKQAAHDIGSVAQFAGGVPAMCDGVTQGQPGMELSLFSRDVIAMATAVALSHNMFDAALCLGVCDKIVPGLFIGALRFGHLPVIFVPAGPMPSGLPNKEKARIRQLFAEGKVGREELLEAESQSYHGPGTCTFYGTANSNQLLVEVMGLHLPGASFVNPNTPLRDELTKEATRQAARITALGSDFTPMYQVVSEKTIINAVVALLATGGSTNHTMHLVAMAAAAGVKITWDDFSELSSVVPLLTKIYPNGQADINHFQAAGGMAFLIRALLDSGLLHDDVTTVVGKGLRQYTQEPFLDGGKLVWRDGVKETHDAEVLRPATNPFSPEGGLKLLNGNIGRGVIKVSAVAKENQIVEAPVVIFHDQNDLAEAFKRGELEKDFIAVVRFQGPQAIGMPELHKLTPYLGVLQDKGFKVALVTDGRMSGASGKVPAAIHVYPEAAQGGPIAKLREGDVVRLNAETGELTALVDDKEWQQRTTVEVDLSPSHQGMGRELFGQMRAFAGGAEQGASVFGFANEEVK